MSRSRPRLDLVSPLPPVRSGIADYTADLLPALAARCDLRLIATGEAPVDPVVALNLPVVAAERLAEDQRLPLYQMGNNRHHEKVYRLAMAIPGVLVLHDLVLHHFLIGRTAARGHVDVYRQVLLEEHGWIGEAAARPARWPGGQGDAAQFALPAHRRLLVRQRGVLTHSVWARDMLREELPGLAVEAITMGVPLPPLVDPARGRDLRRQLGIPERAAVLGSFGFQTPIKRTGSVLRALATPALADAWLVIGGEVAPASRLAEQAQALGVMDRVRLLGYLPFERLQAAISAVDLCINLRYPTAGETSASLLRILALGRPAVVSDYAQSADLGDDIVCKIPVGEGEVEALVASLPPLLADTARLAAMGRIARRYVAEYHAPQDAARAVVAACRRWRDRPPLAGGEQGQAQRPTPPEATSLILRPLDGRLEVRGLDRPWQPGTRRRFEIDLINDSPGVWLAGERGMGGVALEVRLEAAGVCYRRGAPWMALPEDLAPGARQRFTVELRRPLAPARLRIEPHVFARQGFSRLGGPVWERRFP